MPFRCVTAQTLQSQTQEDVKEGEEGSRKKGKHDDDDNDDHDRERRKQMDGGLWTRSQLFVHKAEDSSFFLFLFSSLLLLA